MSVCKWMIEVCTCAINKMPAQKGFKRSNVDVKSGQVVNQRKSGKMEDNVKDDQSASSFPVKKDFTLQEFSFDAETLAFMQKRDDHKDKVLAQLTSDEFSCGDVYHFTEEIPVVGYVSDAKNSAVQLFKEDSWESHNALHKDFQNRLKNEGVISARTRSHRQLYQSQLEHSFSSDSNSQLVTKSCICLTCDASSPGSCNEPMCHSENEICSRVSAISERSTKNKNIIINSNNRSGSQRGSRNEDGRSQDNESWVCQMNESTESDVNKGHNSSDDLRTCESIIEDFDNEPIHMTLEEVRSSFPICRSSVETSPLETQEVTIGSPLDWNRIDSDRHCKTNGKLRRKKLQFGLCMKSARSTDEEQSLQTYSVRCLPRSFKHTLCHWLGIDKNHPNIPALEPSLDDHSLYDSNGHSPVANSGSIVNRALPPVPRERLNEASEVYSLSSKIMEGDTVPDFAASIQKVKDVSFLSMLFNLRM